jgi:hypothetical protein
MNDLLITLAENTNCSVSYKAWYISLESSTFDRTHFSQLLWMAGKYYIIQRLKEVRHVLREHPE